MSPTESSAPSGPTTAAPAVAHLAFPADVDQQSRYVARARPLRKASLRRRALRQVAQWRRREPKWTHGDGSVWSSLDNYACAMSPPEPMLSSSGRRWPAGGEWVMQPKWDGFRLLIGVEQGGRVRAWSRHGTNLTPRLGSLLECFAAAPPGTVFDGELVALRESAGRPVQDFATVTRAVFTASPVAAQRLRFVGFDALRLGGQDLCVRPWRERDERLRDALPICDRVRAISSQPASPDGHDAIVELGFEGTVLKRPSSTYRPGRHAAWVKHKARHVAAGTLLDVRQARRGEWHAVCDIGGRRITVLAGAGTAALTGQAVELAYSRIDADGGLREARITTAAAA